MSAEQTPDIAEVLAEHEYMLQNSRGSICRCGFVPTVDADSLNTQQDYHRAHVAAALAPVLAAAVREAQIEAWERGNHAGLVFAAAPQRSLLTNPYRADCIEVHWGDVDSRPTSLHGNGAKALGRVTLDVAKVTCRLCLALLSDRADRITEPVSHEAATSGEEGEASDE